MKFNLICSSKASLRLLLVMASVLLAACQDKTVNTPVTPENIKIAGDTFANPLFRNGADPWMHYYNGNYYLTTTTWTSELVMRKSPTIEGLASAPAHNIWTGDQADRCCNFWAFEFFPLQRPEGLRWYVIYTAGIAEDFSGQRNHILESAGSDPMGPYQYKGTPMKDHWNIDGSYFEHDDGLYFLWSEWHGDDQVNLISKMTNPWTLEGERTIITRPVYDWEKSGLNVNEGPEIIKHNGRTFIVHSASFCNTEDYKLAVVELTGDDPLKAESWTKYDEPFFSKGNGVYGPGHHGFFTSPDGSEEWLIYHGNSSPTDGCSGTRAARAQPFTWNEETGLPNFGEPAADKKQIKVPSGESGPLTAQVEGVKYRIVDRQSALCLLTDAKGNTTTGACESSNSEWVIDPANDGYYRLVNTNGKFLTEQACLTEQGDAVVSQPWQANTCQRWSIDASNNGWVRFANEQSIRNLQVNNCSTGENAVVTGENKIHACTDWRLEPVSTFAMINALSGKVITVEECSTEANANISQHAFTNSACQKWQATATDNGYYKFKSVNSDYCLAVQNVNTGKVEIAGNIAQDDCHKPESEWRFELLKNGSLRMVSKLHGLSLKVSGQSIDNNDNIIQEVWKDTIYQHFYFRVAN